MVDDISVKRRFDRILGEFKKEWTADVRPNFQVIVESVAEVHRHELLKSLIQIDVGLRREVGQSIDPMDYQDIGLTFDAVEAIVRSVDNPAEAATKLLFGGAKQPSQIGRYLIEDTLGKGGFGIVYKSYDEQLERHVAIKIPHNHLVNTAHQLYLNEARAVASLGDHPNIVPVYDVGSSDEFPFYIVSKFIDGVNLATKVKTNRPGYNEVARLVMLVSEALHYAHEKGMVHRDIKPGNILVDSTGTPFVVDFGLATKERDVNKQRLYVGTPPYMSPEQARGEGHRVDRRSDIFSLGVVFYELLTGVRPFRADSMELLLHEIATVDPKPPRQIDDTIPKELQRICLRAIRRRAVDRYTTAKDLSDDLNHYLSELLQLGSPETWPESQRTLPDVEYTQIGSDTPQATPTSDLRPIKIVPKGLRSFDEHDADFFLELLPGPTDRDGLPDNLRFWKTRIENTNPNSSFSVGLICGPSGCGKSSFVKAGLIPRLAAHVIPIYVEATADETELTLLSALRQACHSLPTDLDLKDAISWLRRGRSDNDHKYVLIIDQFEQWLQTHVHQENSQLVQALRQCSCESVQCIVMIRDDFWMAVIRFMRELEIRLREDQNSQTVDLFPLRHARKVLAAFGHAYGILPEDTIQLSAEHRAFLDRAVEGLAEDGKVVCVRLALFAEMLKGKPWTLETLEQIGGMAGVGVTFLEETFSASTAPPEHRYHQRAARLVLKQLLPDLGRDIKGHRKSYEELLTASGYQNRPHDFDEMINILDSEVRLISPTDPAASSYGDDFEQSETSTHVESKRSTASEQKFYQLTHDYLVQPLRDWLTRKQRETRRGRAEIKLAESSAFWIGNPKNRFLPSLLEYLRILFFTSRKKWSESQRKMMRKAGLVRLLQWGGFAISLLLIGIIVVRLASVQIQNGVDNLASSRGILVPVAIENLNQLPRVWVLNELREQYAKRSEIEKVPLAFGLVHFDDLDAAVLRFLVEQVQEATDEELENFVTAFETARSDTLGVLRDQARLADAFSKWRQKSRLAIIALHLGNTTLAKEMCQPRPDPAQRTFFIDTLSKWHGDTKKIADVSQDVTNGPLRSGISLGIGNIERPLISPNTLDSWVSLFSNWYESANDGLTHSSAEWALRKWRFDLPEIEPTTEHVGQRDWYVNSLEMTMVRIPPGTFERKIIDVRSPFDQTVSIKRPFMISTKELSNEMYSSFALHGDKNLLMSSDESPTAHHPANRVRWFDAIKICNELSRQEDLDPCYEPKMVKNEESGITEKIWVFDPNANGYRLPTDAEWEYACRAGTTTKFNFGNEESMLDQYAVYGKTESGTCGSKMPNGWGLFDCHGNVWEWCQDWMAAYGTEKSVSDPMGPTQGEVRTLRGGSFYSNPIDLRSENRKESNPDSGKPGHGFRVARTIFP